MMHWFTLSVNLSGILYPDDMYYKLIYIVSNLNRITLTTLTGLFEANIATFLEFTFDFGNNVSSGSRNLSEGDR